MKMRKRHNLLKGSVNATGDSVISGKSLTQENGMLARVFYLGSSAFIMVGYALYFAASFLSPATRVLGLIDALKPTIGSLATAELVGESPFPAQVVIAYSAVTSSFYVPWFFYFILGRKESRMAYRQGVIEAQTRTETLASGLAGIVMAFLWAWFIGRQDSEIGWQERFLLSSNFITASTHILFTPMLCIILLLAAYNIWISLTWQRTQNFIFDSSKSDRRG